VFFVRTATPETMTPLIRVLIVDDSTLVREGLRAVFAMHRREPRIEVAGEAGTVADAITAARDLRPDVVLLDIRLPDGSGLQACAEICRALPATRVLILTSVATDNLIQQAIHAGAQGYLMKEIDPEGLVRAIADAHAGRSVLTGEVTARVLRLLREGPADPLAPLSPQEHRVLALTAEGRSNKEIAHELGLSEKTVKNYLSRVFEKLNVSRRTQAAAVYSQALAKGVGPKVPVA
jgi:Response regulator containing a CheY-like receiver domain and an HTH DNA-binding domain